MRLKQLLANDMSFQLLSEHINCLMLNPFSTVPRFHIHSAYYLVILYGFKNLCRGLE
ncbi:hypothetical protein E2C01_018826 [Portunus trituberculatus]|uniref:Uncharacterized protein n=1 Tax=Portunus trituberculatus TaxID=210409 RepID=A0A5B7DVI9_PORTR|nr:hypothetical protein [Portunus trituberculatus]